MTEKKDAPKKKQYKYRVNYPRKPIELERLGDACYGVLRRLITDIRAKARKHIELSRNEVDLIWRIINLQPGKLKHKAFLRTVDHPDRDLADKDELDNELDKEVQDDAVTEEEESGIGEVDLSIEDLMAETDRDEDSDSGDNSRSARAS